MNVEVHEHRLAKGLEVCRFPQEETRKLAEAMAQQGWVAGVSTVANGDWHWGKAAAAA